MQDDKLTIENRTNNRKIFIVANTSWFVVNFELSLIHELQSLGMEIVAVAPKDTYSILFYDNNIRFIDIPMNRRSKNPISDIGLMIRLFRILRKERPEIVLFNTIKPVIYGSIVCSFAGIKRNIAMIPGLGHIFVGDKLKQKYLRIFIEYFYRYALSKSYKVLFQNPDDRDYFIKKKIVQPEKVELTYGLGVDTEKFYYVEPNKNVHSCRFILVSRMLWDKGVGEFVAAAERIKKKYSNVKCQLLGKIDKDNPSGIELEKIKEWESAGSIEYLGEVSDVRNILKDAEAVVLPSYYREGIPNALLEGMAMGKPIITTDMPGCKETVIDNVNGLLIPPKNVDALVKAMEFMVLNPEKRNLMGKKSRELVIKKFDIKLVNKIIIKSMNLNSGNQSVN